MPCFLINFDNVLTLYRMQTYTTIRFVGSDKNPVNVKGFYLSPQQNGLAACLEFAGRVGIVAPCLLRAVFQFAKRAAGEAAKFGRTRVELLGVLRSARLECGEPTAEAGELIRRRLGAIASAISSTSMGRYIAPLGLAGRWNGIGCGAPNRSSAQLGGMAVEVARLGRKNFGKIRTVDGAEVEDSVRPRSLILSIHSIDGCSSNSANCENCQSQCDRSVHGVLPCLFFKRLA